MNQPVTPVVHQPSAGGIFRGNRLLVLLVTTWSLLLLASFGWNARVERLRVHDLVLSQARALVAKDIMYRHWNASLGGVWADARLVAPNPWLADMVSKRDVMTRDGMLLTLINPAYMTRMVFDIQKQQLAVRAKITSLKPINQANRPDAWEAEALRLAERGTLEVHDDEHFDGQPWMRYLRALATEEECLKCHSRQGYKLGDIRGGISVSIPLRQPYEASNRNLVVLGGTHAVLWLVGLLGLGVGHRSYRRHEAGLTAAKEAAEAADRAKGAFIANMSHEIRTPLNAIMGMTHLIRRAGVSPKQDEQLGKVDAAGRHLLDTLNAILDYARIESGQIRLDSTDIDLGEILDSVAAEIRDEARAKGLTVDVERPVPAERLRGDAARVRSALLNYARNATKFTERGGIVLRARIEAATQHDVLVRLEVADTGAGIPADVLSGLFSGFHQGDDSSTRRHGGVGLGLAITRRLAELMGGGAGATSQEGVGSTFWFTARLERTAVSAG